MIRAAQPMGPAISAGLPGAVAASIWPNALVKTSQACPLAADRLIAEPRHQHTAAEGEPVHLGHGHRRKPETPSGAEPFKRHRIGPVELPFF
jgi:hypothetical protein